MVVPPIHPNSTVLALKPMVALQTSACLMSVSAAEVLKKALANGVFLDLHNVTFAKPAAAWPQTF